MLDTTDVAPGFDLGPATRTRRKVGHPAALAGLCVLACLVYAAAGFFQVLKLHAGTYDLALFDQAVRSYSHLAPGLSVVDGVHRGFGLGFSVLGDHFSPIIALLAPLYWIHAGPATLIVAQALLVAAAIPPLWVFTRRELGAAWMAYCVALAYALSWPVAAGVSFDFHEAAFAPLLMAVLFERFSALRAGGARWWHVALPAFGLLLVKEDMGLFVAAFGLAVLVRSLRWPGARRPVRLLGGGFVVGGLLATAILTSVVLPAFGADPRYYWRYGAFGPSAPGAVLGMLTHPALTLHTAVTPEVKVHTVVCLFALTAFVGLLSPYLLAVAPLLTERMLADAPSWWSMSFHYNLFLIVPLLCGGVDAIVRLGRWTRRWRADRWLRPAWAVVVLVVAVWNVPGSAFGPLPDPSSWRPTEQTRAAAAAVARVPSGVTVETANNLGPLLTGRDTVLLWDRVPRWAPWIVADVARGVFPFCSLAEQQSRVGYLESHGYRQVFADDGYVVLHADASPPIDTRRPPGCP